MIKEIENFKYTHLYLLMCMPEKATKSRYNFTIDKKLFDRFRAYCKENCINMSAKVESYIRKEVKDGAK